MQTSPAFQSPCSASSDLREGDFFLASCPQSADNQRPHEKRKAPNYDLASGKSGFGIHNVQDGPAI
jgi:hypothetical protein